MCQAIISVSKEVQYLMYNCVHLLMHYYRHPPLIKELFKKDTSSTKVKASYKQKIVGAFLSVINKLTSY